MNKSLLLLIALVLPFFGFTQSDDIQLMHANAKKFMNQGDYSNATLVLTRLHNQVPFISDISMDLAYCYYMQGDYDKALKVVNPYLNKKGSEEDAFRLAGMIYQKADKLKDAEKTYKKGLKMYPESGKLYDGYGELLWSQRDFTAIDQWENGIKAAPNYPDNYLNATRFYYASREGIWPIIYGEMFLNLEPATKRSGEIKDILVNSYKNLFTTVDAVKSTKKLSDFEKNYLHIIDSYGNIISQGINIETLTMIRTRFILDWFKEGAQKFPFVLFDKHKYMLENGLFQAYNQWLFGGSQNQSALKHWIELHRNEYTAFAEYLQYNRFYVPSGQYYKR